MSQVLNIYTDGGARGNPGPAAIGVVVKNEQGKDVHKFGQTIGEATNNVAEYRAVIAALEWIKVQARPERVNFYSDSTLIVHQIKGEWKVKEGHLRPLIERIRRLAQDLVVTFTAIPRERNFQADALVNQSLDKC